MTRKLLSKEHLHLPMALAPNLWLMNGGGTSPAAYQARRGILRLLAAPLRRLSGSAFAALANTVLLRNDVVRVAVAT